MRKFIISIFLISTINLWAQSKEDVAWVKKNAPFEQTEITYKNSSNNKNEFELIFSGLFLLYKTAISSQDVPGVCVYTPSCSEFGLLSIKRKGIFLGVLNTFDRLTRCHGMSEEFYFKDEITRKLIDNP